jgi:hypothetical protein
MNAFDFAMAAALAVPVYTMVREHGQLEIHALIPWCVAPPVVALVVSVIVANMEHLTSIASLWWLPALAACFCAIRPLRKLARLSMKNR